MENLEKYLLFFALKKWSSIEKKLIKNLDYGICITEPPLMEFSIIFFLNEGFIENILLTFKHGELFNFLNKLPLDIHGISFFILEILCRNPSSLLCQMFSDIPPVSIIPFQNIHPLSFNKIHGFASLRHKGSQCIESISL